MVLPACDFSRLSLPCQPCQHTLYPGRNPRGQRPVVRRGYQRLPGGAL